MSEGRLERETQAAFPEQWREAVAELRTYGTEPWEREHERVRRAILTLANGDLNRLRHFTQRAREDYRDVLMWAEYPDASKDITEDDVRALMEKFGRPETS